MWTRAPQPLPDEDRHTTLLVVDDQHDVARVLGASPARYRVVHAARVSEARTLLADIEPDLVVLDVVLPDADGLVFCSDLAMRTQVPILICSATHRKADAVLALKLGADAFVAKPFEPDELLARVEALLRRAQGAPHAPPAPQPAPAISNPDVAHTTSSAALLRPNRDLAVGNLLLQPSRRQVMLGGEPLPLTSIEYRVLMALMARPDEALSRQELISVAWGQDGMSTGRSVDIHVQHLRTKLLAHERRIGVASPPIITLRGFGYRLLDESARRHEPGAA